MWPNTKPAFNTGATIFLLFVVCFVIYYQLTGHHFLTHWDDRDYITENTHVTGGLTTASITWAFTSFHSSNWHPLTWISHMADIELFGLNAGLHLSTNALLHFCNSVLLLLLFNRLTKRLFPSAVVALLFAVHPLHVESVAWLSERKDLLNALFFLLVLHAYTSYVHRKSVAYFFVAIALFGLGLMTKAMIVTLPFVLLLLDYWPLQRSKMILWQTPESRSRLIPRHMFLLDKIPFLALSAAASAITYFAQSSGHAVSESLPLLHRLINADISYITYLYLTFNPTQLSFFYPHGQYFSILGALTAMVVLATVTLAAFRVRHHHPYIIFGWLFFLGCLVPVIGIIQVGSQAYADRYTYIPLIGIFTIIAYSLDQIDRPRLRIGIVVAMVSILTLLAHKQASYWKDSKTLFERAIALDEKNWRALHLLALYHLNNDNNELAQTLVLRSVRAAPRMATTHFLYGRILYADGDLKGAELPYLRAIKFNREMPRYHFNLAMLYLEMDRAEDAVQHFIHSMSYPNAPQIHIDVSGYVNMGNAFYGTQDFAQAEAQYRAALALDPRAEEALFNLGLTYKKSNRRRDAIERFNDLLDINNEHHRAARQLISIYLDAGDKRTALRLASDYRALLELDPKGRQLLQRLSNRPQ